VKKVQSKITDVRALGLRREAVYEHDALKYWAEKLATVLRPLALVAIKVLTVPRSGAIIECAFSLVVLLQVSYILFICLHLIYRPTDGFASAHISRM
jgi:hypothetical protein